MPSQTATENAMPEQATDKPYMYKSKDTLVSIHSDHHLEPDAVEGYAARAEEKFPSCEIDVYIEEDGDHVKVWYNWRAIRFERIRRITGYLVGTLDRFNDAKRAEESERVKHSLG